MMLIHEFHVVPTSHINGWCMNFMYQVIHELGMQLFHHTIRFKHRKTKYFEVFEIYDETWSTSFCMIWLLKQYYAPLTSMKNVGSCLICLFGRQSVHHAFVKQAKISWRNHRRSFLHKTRRQEFRCNNKKEKQTKTNKQTKNTWMVKVWRVEG